MKQPIYLFAVLAALFACTTTVLANGDPVTRYSSIMRVGNPEPMAIPEISILKENIVITHENGYNCFDVTYWLKNNSDKTFDNIDYGFPIDYYIADEKEVYKMEGDYYTEGSHETGWNEKLIKDVVFTLNGRRLDFHVSKESVREISFETEEVYGDGDTVLIDGTNRRWFYTAFSVSSDSTVELNVRYKVYAESRMPLYPSESYYERFPYNDTCSRPEYYNMTLSRIRRLFNNRFSIVYDFTPAKYFGDGSNGFPINVNFNFVNLTDPFVVAWNKNPVKVTEFSDSLTFSPTEIPEPIVLTVYYTPDWSDKKLESAFTPITIPSSKYEIKEQGSDVVLQFREPTAVTDILCNPDTSKVEDIKAEVTYADGRVSKFSFEHPTHFCESVFGFENEGKFFVLTINDILGPDSRASYDPDNIHGEQVQPMLEVTKIVLKAASETGKSPKGWLRDIRPINACFLIE